MGNAGVELSWAGLGMGPLSGWLGTTLHAGPPPSELLLVITQHTQKKWTRAGRGDKTKWAEKGAQK